MMLPQINPSSAGRDFIEAFGGYHNTERCEQNESSNELNITSDAFPVLTPRRPRVKYWSIPNEYSAGREKITGLIVNEDLLATFDNPSVHGFSLINTETNQILASQGYVGSTPPQGKKQICNMGSYVVIWPDKLLVNTYQYSADRIQSLEWDFKLDYDVTFTPCTLDGSDTNQVVSSTAPTVVYDGMYWLDTSVNPNVLKRWTAAQSQWVSVPTAYVRISDNHDHEYAWRHLKEMDVVKISGVVGTYADTLNTDMCVWKKTDTYIVVTALINQAFTQSVSSGKVGLKRKIPEMDFICEHNNRIWGCSSKNHEIYASKLGDATNWYSYLGTSEDSYAATIGRGGEFTGCAAQGTGVVFFKEDCVIKVYGQYPANYQITTYEYTGVQKGCERSIKAINDVLYYKAPDGVYAYDGTIPRKISDNLGDKVYKNATAGVWRDKYYICMEDEAGVAYTFVYDTKKNLWHVEDIGLNDPTGIFVTYKDRLMFNKGSRNIIAENDDKIGDTTYPTDVDDADGVPWAWVSGMIGFDNPGTKYISQILIRMSMEMGATLKIKIEYDSSGEYEDVTTIKNEYNVSRRNTPGYTKVRTLEIPIIPKRCDHMRLAFEGTKTTKIFSISKRIEQGGSI